MAAPPSPSTVSRCCSWTSSDCWVSLERCRVFTALHFKAAGGDCGCELVPCSKSEINLKLQISTDVCSAGFSFTLLSCWHKNTFYSSLFAECYWTGLSPLSLTEGSTTITLHWHQWCRLLSLWMLEEHTGNFLLADFIRPLLFLGSFQRPGLGKYLRVFILRWNSRFLFRNKSWPKLISVWRVKPELKVLKPAFFLTVSRRRWLARHVVAG